jgi:arylsulfatase A-like enzyme
MNMLKRVLLNEDFGFGGAWRWSPLLCSLVLAGVFPWGVASCQRDEPSAARNVVIIVVDTLRRDHLGAYGYDRDTSPAIDALALEGVSFDRAYATCGWTAPSVASMLTGLYPSAHGMTNPGKALPEGVLTLPEMLREEGFATAAVVSNQLIGKRTGLERGFDLFDEGNIKGHDGLSTDGVTETALAMLDDLSSRDAPFFLFVHYFDPHYVYLRHDEYDFAPERVGRLTGMEGIRALRLLEPGMTEEEISFVQDLYDGEIRFTDAGVGRLLSALKTGGRYEDTLIVFTSDHGEEFLERGWLGHTRSLYDELVRVPLILRLPRWSGDEVIHEPVSLTSLAPTIMELLGLEIPESMPQHSLVGHLVHSRPESTRAAILTEVDFVAPSGPGRWSEKTAQKQSLIGPRYKLIRDLLNDELELYDLDRDPDELVDLAAQQPERVRAMEQELDALMAEVKSTSVQGHERQLSEEELRALEALGYVDGEEDAATDDD